VTEGERFSVVSREGALVVNNVMLRAIAGHRPVRHALSAAGRSAGRQGFGRPALFQSDERGVRAADAGRLAVGPLLRWRRDALSGSRKLLILPLAVLGVGVMALISGMKLLPLLGMALAFGPWHWPACCRCGRRLRTLALAVDGAWFWPISGWRWRCSGWPPMKAPSRQSELVAANPGDTVEVGPWQVKLEQVVPVAGPNWTALEATDSGALSRRQAD
jgi:cytochrome c-type biogenesis protein CcmF